MRPRSLASAPPLAGALHLAGALAATLVVACFTACGDDDGESTTSGCGTESCCDGTCIGGTGGGNGDGGSGSGTGGGDVGACGLGAVVNDEVCAADAPALDCGAVSGDDAYALCGVALPAPALGPETADGSCFAPSSYPAPPGAVGSTRLEGHVRIFANGCESSNVTVEVFTVEDDGSLGARIGISATTPASCETGEPSASMDCPDDVRHECAYVYPSVPTETRLAIKTSGPSWTPLIDDGVFITNAASASGQFQYDPRALNVDDYGVIAQAAIGHPVTAGHGTILGVVRDCGGSPIAGAVVGTDAPQLGFAYLTTDGTLPDLDASTTSASGRWAAFDIAPRRVRVAAAASYDGAVGNIGFRDVRVLPDTVTWVGLQGPLPSDVPTE